MDVQAPMNHIDNSTKLIGTIGYLSLTISLVLAILEPPAVNYEFYIYKSLSPLFWFFSFGSFMIGFITHIHSSRESEYLNWLGMLLCMMSTTTILLVPHIRGYAFMGQGDVLTHVGYVRDILSLGNFGYNPYPLDHILASSIMYITGISISNTFTLIPLSFYIFGMIFTYLLAKCLSINGIEHALIPIILIPIFGSYCYTYAPWFQSFFTIPLMLYLYYKYTMDCQRTKYYIAFIVLIVALVPYHPLTAGITAIMFILLEVSLIIQRYNYKKSNRSDYKLRIFPCILSMGIMLLIFAWPPYLNMVNNIANSIYEKFIIKSGVSEVSQYMFAVNHLSDYLIDTIILLIVRYLPFALVFAAFVVGMWIILKRKFIYSVSSNGHPSYIFLTTCIATFTLIMAFLAFGIRVFDTTRITNLLILIIVIFILIIPWGSYANTRKISKRLIICVSAAIILIVLLSSIANLYPSELKMQANDQVSSQSIYGMSFFFQCRDDSVPIKEMGISQYRYHDAIMGVSEPDKNIRFISPVPKHFGYYGESGNQKLDNNYIIITTQGEQLYEKIYPSFTKLWSFYPDDYQMFRYDMDTSIIFKNRDLSIYIYS